jgi:hypothetical protein
MELIDRDSKRKPYPKNIILSIFNKKEKRVVFKEAKEIP